MLRGKECLFVVILYPCSYKGAGIRSLVDQQQGSALLRNPSHSCGTVISRAKASNGRGWKDRRASEIPARFLRQDSFCVVVQGRGQDRKKANIVMFHTQERQDGQYNAFKTNDGLGDAQEIREKDGKEDVPKSVGFVRDERFCCSLENGESLGLGCIKFLCFVL
jgi:hypothetical protein